MKLKITGLRIDTGEEPSAKVMSQKANLLAMKAQQEEDPKKKKALEEKVAKGDMLAEDLEHPCSPQEKAEKKNRKKHKKALGGASNPSTGTVGGGLGSGGGNGGGGGE